MGRAPCCDKGNVKKGPWSPEEDEKLKEYMQKHGTGGNWIALPQKAGLRRCGKSCRLRWLNYLRPNIKHGEFTDDEDRVICSLFASIGSRWSIIAAQLPGRTDNDIKNYWNTKLKKKLMSRMVPYPHSQKRPNYPSVSILQGKFHAQTTTSSFSGYGLPISTPSSILNARSTVVQAQEGYVGPHHHNQVKDRVLMFGGGGGGGGEASCSSSDGSCCNNKMISHDQYNNYGVSNGADQNMCLQSYLHHGDYGQDQKFTVFNGGDPDPEGSTDQKPNRVSSEGENPIDYSSLEEIKQLIGTSNICDNLNFLC